MGGIAVLHPKDNAGADRPAGDVEGATEPVRDAGPADRVAGAGPDLVAGVEQGDPVPSAPVEGDGIPDGQGIIRNDRVAVLQEVADRDRLSGDVEGARGNGGGRRGVGGVGVVYDQLDVRPDHPGQRLEVVDGEGAVVGRDSGAGGDRLRRANADRVFDVEGGDPGVGPGDLDRVVHGDGRSGQGVAAGRDGGGI